ncbi:alpha/beta hydrolase [Actinomycetospora cinnamomea]|uniref:Pimeloyl-ACP methyl ester carboxylesterase n=1 Tax=Actinomycetospora cinnamomea TaxID=663609 RepID=A0A2U1FHQ3_9PSEU|nr:alpha/beta hydrolase [Actinomycetospora cinnamomea]PVZ11687.1 pimeloyl-ACP methyl ester carboxylesterase [Actinomycetospora cinnamomea]
MRARYPDHTGSVDRDGVRVHYEVYENDAPTVVLMPSWSIVHARVWKAQIPYLARHWRVVVVDGRGNGRSDRPTGPTAYADDQYVDDTIAVLDATTTTEALVVALSRGAKYAVLLAARHPERVSGMALIAPGIPFTSHPVLTAARFTAEVAAPEGWDKFNARHWRDDWPDFLGFFFGRVFPEPHSSKHIEDGVRWGLDTTPEVVVDTMRARLDDPVDFETVVGSLRCPVLVLHAPDDEINPYAWGARTAELTGGTLVTLEGSGHAPNARDPVVVNRLVHDFACRVTGRRVDARTWSRPRSRPRRALYLSSPIGLGHVRRDRAVAEELRRRVPDLAIDWLTQDPVSSVLARAGERVHPAGRSLASESAHLESESGEHDLHCFRTFREMDEILVANFHLFQEVVEDGGYDLVVADEAWDVDHFWHEHPHLKRAPLAWLTDFVGFLPMDDGDAEEARLAADHNAEMLEHVERHGWVRDRSIFVGNPEDVVPGTFGPGLPGIREWTEEHFSFPGYVTGFDPDTLSDREALRAELGYSPDEQVCLVTVGGSGVGTDLLRRVVDAYPAAARRVPGLRMVVVTGPRIDPAALPRRDGVEARAYVPDLHRHLAACDLAVVQGGLSTTMELTAAKRPFLYVPLRHHFEQQYHVRHRLDRHGAGRRLDYAGADPDVVAEAIATEIGRPVRYRDVETDGAARAADLLAELL